MMKWFLVIGCNKLNLVKSIINKLVIPILAVFPIVVVAPLTKGTKSNGKIFHH